MYELAQVYDLARGPLMWVAAIVFLGGIGYRIYQLVQLTKKKQRIVAPARNVREASSEERKLQTVVAFQNSFLGQHPVMAIATCVFHCCLLVVPLFVFAHNELLRESWGISLFSFPGFDWVVDLMTVIVLIGVLFFLMRRLVVPRVRAVSTVSDFAVLFITAAPYLTGFIAYHQWGDYKTVITLHALAGVVMLIAVPFTKLGHMVFFFFARFLMGGEYGFWRGNRTWSA